MGTPRAATHTTMSGMRSIDQGPSVWTGPPQAQQDAPDGVRGVLSEAMATVQQKGGREGAGVGAHLSGTVPACQVATVPAA
jgi:hypothetical protein